MFLRRLAPACLAALLVGACAPAPDRAADEKTIKDGEAAWAEAVALGDTATVGRLLADDYRGVAPDGSTTDKKSELEDTPSGPSRFVSNQLVEVHVRFYGDTAVAQGSDVWEKRDGEPRRGRYVWTDTWVKRGGHWQVVAGEDLVVADATPPATAPTP
jgi:ketosteroid isomerase-like protein